MINPSDINFVYSGGTTNNDPAHSLGGEPSNRPITGQLLPEISIAQALKGFTDYHCLYIVNDGSDSLYSTELYIDDEATGGVPVSLGFQFQDDIQQVTVADGVDVTGGLMLLQYEGTNFTVYWAAGINDWAASFQDAISAFSSLADVTVTGRVQGNDCIFQVNFVGTAGSRYHDLLAVIDDSTLFGISADSVSVLKLFDGAPINSIAPEIDSSTTAPNGILFYIPISDQPLVLGEFRGADILPVWVQRACPPNQAALADGFALKMSGTPFLA